MFGVSLVLGWQLFHVGVLKDQSAEFSGKGWRVRLQRVGPGLFFALFGAVGLVVALQKPLSETTVHTYSNANLPQGQKEQTSVSSSVSYAGPENSETREYIAALTTVEDLGIRDDGTRTAEKIALLKAKPILERHRQGLLRSVFPKYDWYVAVKQAGSAQLNRLSAADRKTYDEIDEFVTATLISN